MTISTKKEEVNSDDKKEKNIIILSKFSPVPYAKELRKENTFIYDKNKTFWKYDEKTGLWNPHAEQFVRTTLRNQLIGDEQQLKRCVEEIVSYIKDITYDEDFETNKNPYFIAFKNKVFDLKKKEFINFSPKLYLTNKLEIEIDEEIKECPRIEKFFIDCIGEEHKQILYDLIAYTLFKEIPYQKIFFIYGSAGTGKSKFMELFEYFLGEENCCSVEPRTIQKDIHATSTMLYKLSNIVSDINYDEFDNITQVKKLSGGDTVTIRQMYKDPFNAKIFAKQIYSTNKMPVVKEKTNAWYRRVYPIEFPNPVPQENRDPFIMQKLIDKKEIRGLAYMCLKSLIELSENNFVFSFDIDEKEMGKAYEELSNPILMFINENCKTDSLEWCYKFEFSERLNNWARHNHFPAYTSTQINQYMKEYYNESQRPSQNENNKSWRTWTGLGWKPLNQVPKNNQSHFNNKIKKLYIPRKKAEPKVEIQENL